MTVARGDIVNLDERGIYHCCGRCVRRAFLCGDDPYTGRNFEHRRGWVRDRLELLAEAFGIDVFTYAVMSNHVHLVVRNRPDLAAAWSPQEVLDRWAMLYPTGGGCAATATASTQAAGVAGGGKAEADSVRRDDRDDCAVADDAAGGVAVDHASLVDSKRDGRVIRPGKPGRITRPCPPVIVPRFAFYGPNMDPSRHTPLQTQHDPAAR